MSSRRLRFDEQVQIFVEYPFPPSCEDDDMGDFFADIVLYDDFVASRLFMLRGDFDLDSFQPSDLDFDPTIKQGIEHFLREYPDTRYSGTLLQINISDATITCHSERSRGILNVIVSYKS